MSKVKLSEPSFEEYSITPLGSFHPPCFNSPSMWEGGGGYLTSAAGGETLTLFGKKQKNITLSIFEDPV